MLKRLGHSETYRFTLKLETANAKVLQESSSLVSTQIVVNLSVSAKALQESSNLLSTQVVVNPAAIAYAFQGSSNLLSTQVVANPAAPLVFHFEFDNFGQFLNKYTGGTHASWYNHGISKQMTHFAFVHTAHCIMLQDIEGEHHGKTRLVLPSMPQTGMQTLEIAQDELPDCCITTRKSPFLHIVQRTFFAGEE